MKKFSQQELAQVLLLILWSPLSNAECPADYTGFLAINACRSYVNCWAGVQQYQIDCEEGLLYDELNGWCSQAELVTCSLTETPGTPETPATAEIPDAEMLLGDILYDAACPNWHTGRLGVNDCTGYVECDVGFVVGRVTCDDGWMFNADTKECEDAVITECGTTGSSSSMSPPIGGTTPPPPPPVIIDPNDSATTPTPPVFVDVTCPSGYTGRTGTYDCHGYVDCVDGMSTKRTVCEGDLMFDVSAQMCADIVITDASQCAVPDVIYDADGASTSSKPTPVDDTGLKPPVTTETPIPLDDKVSTSSLPTPVDDTGLHLVTTTTNATTTVADVNEGTTASTTSSEVPSMPTTLHSTTTTPKSSSLPNTGSDSTLQKYYPDWKSKKCLLNDGLINFGLGDWYQYYSSQYECCESNFLYNLNQFSSCLGYDLELLEEMVNPPTSSLHPSTKYFPDWIGNTCATSNPPDWMNGSMKRNKKYLCCFEYFSWNFDDCMFGDGGMGSGRL